MPLSAEVEELADRIRHLLADRPEITERTMFGGVAFMLNGNMMVGPMKDGTLMARVGEDYLETAVALPGAARMQMGERKMKGYVEVSPDVIETDDDLAGWIAQAEQFVEKMPAK